MDSSTSSLFWDPVGETITQQTFYSDQQSLLEKYLRYKKDPYYLRNVFYLICIGAVLTSFSMIYFIHIASGIVFLPFIAPIYYSQYVHKLQEDLVLFLVAKDYGWAYSPNNHDSRADLLSEKFPLIFQQGRDQNLSNEFWGKLDTGSISVPFWQGLYTYVTGYGKHKQTHDKSVFGMHLPKVLPTSFIVSRETFMDDVFSKGDLQTESAKFNSMLKVKALEKDKADVQQKIIQVLSPSVQMRLLDFHDKYMIHMILFTQDMVIFSFEDNLFRVKKTNFLKKVELNAEDKKNIEKELLNLVQLPTDMVHYLD